MIAGHPRLLLVEDSETQAIQLRLLLEGGGFDVVRTRTAEEALDRLNDGRFDLMVVDYRLPGMNGDELVRVVRQAGVTRTLPIVMLTEDRGQELERQGLDSGANAYLPKSSEPALLVTRMRALLRQRRSTVEPDEASTFRKARLLLVEDSATYRLFLQALLQGEGHEVLTADDPVAITATLDRDGIDCVMVGLDSRRQDAFDLCRRLDARRGRVGETFEIVALGGDGSDDAVVRALGAGADDVVPKANDRDMLLVRIRAIVRRKLARDEEARSSARERQRDLTLEHARARAEAAEALAIANRDLAAANAQLRETQGQLVQAAKMASLGELVAGIAHEINNPLAFIMAHQSTIARAVDAAKALEGEEKSAKLARAADRLKAMLAGLVRIQDLVVKLRRFSRLDDGEKMQVDVPEAIDAVLVLLGPKLGDGVAIRRDYAAPPMLYCAPALINQVVMNILANAADVLPGGGTIEIATRLDDGDYVIEIGDTGPGVPDELRTRVFEPFFTTKDVGAGTGLGLAIAYGVVRAHGGSIAIGERQGGGALFTMTMRATTTA